jgi:hypothetical protein
MLLLIVAVLLINVPANHGDPIQQDTDEGGHVQALDGAGLASTMKNLPGPEHRKTGIPDEQLNVHRMTMLWTGMGPDPSDRFRVNQRNLGGGAISGSVYTIWFSTIWICSIW